jgi:hypothetical protein
MFMLLIFVFDNLYECQMFFSLEALSSFSIFFVFILQTMFLALKVIKMCPKKMIEPKVDVTEEPS